MKKRLVRRGCGTVRMVALVSAAAMMLVAGLTLASCASIDGTTRPKATKVEASDAKVTNHEPTKKDAPKSEAVKDATAQQSEPVKASEMHALREGKDEITVLVLNACGVEGAAAEAAEKVKALGFKNVKTGNATFHQQENRVSYHHEEHRAEVEEVASLFEYLPPFDPYCYEDAWSGGWSMDYDILVMVGRPSAS